MSNGLLNFYNDPQAMGLLGLAGGLLNAAGPSRTPVSFGQAAGAGLMQGAQFGQNAAQNQLAQTYLGEQIKQLQAANTRHAALAPIMQQIASRFQTPPGGAQPAPGNPMVPGHPGSSVMAGGPVAQDLKQIPTQTPAQQPHGGFPLSLEDITLLKLIGGPDLTSAFTAGRPHLAVEGGLMIDRHRGVVGTVPQMNQQGFSTQLVPDGRGGYTVAVTPGAQEAFGTQQDITEAARARRDPFMGVTDAQGRPIPMTREGFSQQFGGVSTPGAPVAPPALPPRGVGPSPAVRQAATTAGEGDARRILELEAKIPSMLSVIRRLDRMEGLTKDDQTYAAAGSELKTLLGSVAQGFGLKVKQEKTGNAEEYLAHVAELLKDRLASKDYGSGSGVSNLDLIAARAPLPEIAKTAQGRQQIIQALRADTERNLKDAQAARDFFDTNSGLRGFRFPSELAAEQERRRRDLPKAPGEPPAGVALPQGVTVRRVR